MRQALRPQKLLGKHGPSSESLRDLTEQCCLTSAQTRLVGIGNLTDSLKSHLEARSPLGLARITTLLQSKLSLTQ